MASTSDHEYTMQNIDVQSGEIVESRLGTSLVEKDLGILVDNDLHFSSQVDSVVSRANRLLGMIRRTFMYLDAVTFLFLYRGLVRPMLEYGIVVWNPIKKSKLHSLESIQRRATKLIPKLKSLSYPDRLRSLDLPSLTFRRARGDMIETFKYMNGYYDVGREKLFKLMVNSRTRGHSLRIDKVRCKTAIRSHFFTQRVVNTWNKLPENIALAPSVNCMKARLDVFWKDHPSKYDYTAEL